VSSIVSGLVREVRVLDEESVEILMQRQFGRFSAFAYGPIGLLCQKAVQSGDFIRLRGRWVPGGNLVVNEFLPSKEYV
jgi:hypothetical protein